MDLPEDSPGKRRVPGLVQAVTELALLKLETARLTARR